MIEQDYWEEQRRKAQENGQMAPQQASSKPAIPQDMEDAYWEKAKQQSGQASSLRQAVRYGVQQNPDEYAKLLALAAKTGVPPAIVKDFKPDVEQAANANAIDYETFISRAPRIAAWASDPHNAAVAHDELENLAQVEAMKDAAPLAGLTPSQRAAVIEERKRVFMFNHQRGEVNSAVSNTNTAFYSPFLFLGGMIGSVLGAASESVNPLMDMVASGRDPLPELQRIWTDTTPSKPQQLAHSAQQWLASGIKTGPQAKLVDPQTGQQFDNPDYRWWGRDTVNAIQGVPGGLAGFAVGAELAGGSHMAMPAVMGLEKQSQAYSEAKAAGADERTALLASTGQGLATFGMMAALPAPTPTKTILGSLGQAGLRGAALGVGMTATDNALAQAYDPNRDLLHGWQTGITSMMAYEVAGAIPHMIGLAEQSKLKQRSVEKYREAVQNAVEGTPYESLRIPVSEWDLYWQTNNMDPARMADQIGAGRAYAEAKLGAGGDDLVVPSADLLARVGNEHLKGLQQDIRGYDEMGRPTATPRERESFIKEGGPTKLAEMAKEVDAETKAAPEYAQTKEEIRRRSEAAGERPEIAESNATLMANVYSNLAKHTGMKPTELLAIYDPKITIGEAPAGSMAGRAPEAPAGFKFREGGKNPIEVNVVHYSQVEGLAALDPARSGTGTRGAEQRRLAELAVDDALRQRVYFYARPGAEVPAAERLVTGRNIYEAKLSNVYDIAADPEGLRANANSANDMERAIINAGYDGYWSPQPGDHGAVVLLGTGEVPVSQMRDTLAQGPVMTNRDLLRTARQVIGGQEKGSYSEFRAAMKERLGKAYKELEFGGEKGDKALRLIFDKAQEKELPGAPSTVRTPADRQALLDSMVEMAKRGEAGRFWYDESAKAFLDLAGGDRLKAFKLATLTALYSPQTSVADNGRRAILAYYDAMHNMEVSAGGVHPKVKELAQRVMDAKTMEEVAAVMSGQKTSAFQQNLLNLFAPEHANDDIATIDLHMMRAFGYDTEAPTPTQYKWAEQLTRDVATELGWGSPKEAQAAIWVAQKMKTDNGGKGSDAQQAGFHYGDAARKIAGSVNVEAMPGSDVVRSIFPGIDKATRPELEQYHREKMDIVREELKKAGVMVAGENTGHGYWDGVSNPVTSFLIPLPHIGSEGDHTMSPSARAEIERAAKVVLDLVGDQDAIGWNKPFASTKVGEANGVHFGLDRHLTNAEMKTLGDAFAKAGLDAFIDASDPKNLKVINYGWDGVTKGETGAAASKLAKEYHKSLEELILNNLPDDVTSDVNLYHAESGLVSKETPNASEEARRDGLPAGDAPAVQAGGDADGRAKIEALNERYRTEYGWGSADPNDRGTRGGGRDLAVLYQGPDGLTPGWSGRELLSNEELRRQARGDAYYRVDRSGRITYLGAQPDATVRNGEAILMVDGATGKPQVQNSMGLGPDAGVLARFGDRVAQAHAELRTLYAGGADQPRGWFRVLPDGTFEIGKTKIGDLSTFVHEPAHSYLFMIDDLVKREGASDALKDDAQKIARFLGAEDLSNLTRDQHEKWARANEQYLREGKAPSDGLRGVFQRFAVWLSSIYRKASDLGVELDPDIRGVFDRLYAADEGVTKAHDDVAGPQLFKSPEEAGWTPEQFAKYAEAKGIEVDQARAEILSKLNEAAMRERTAEWQEEERRVREAVAAEVDSRPEFTAIRSLRKGAMDDGTPITLNREALVRQFGEDRVAELQKQHPNVYRKEGGVDADTAAELLGFPSGEELFRTLVETPKRNEAIDDAARKFMIEKHGDIRYDGSIQEKAQVSVANERRAENLHKELEALARKNNPEAELAAAKREIAALEREQNQADKQKDRIEKRDQRIAELRQKIADMEAQAVQDRRDQRAGVRFAKATPPLEAFRATAANVIETKPIMDLDPNRYLGAQRRFSREAYDLMARGDYWGAREAKQRELMNHFLFVEATKAKQEAERTYDYVKKFGKATIREKIAKAGGEQGQHVYLDQIDQLLEKFQFTPETNKSIRQRQALEAFIMDQQAQGEPVEIDPVVLGLGQKNYRELTMPELRAVRDAIRNVEALAKNQYGFIQDGRRISFELESARFEESVRANISSKPVPRTGTDFSTSEKAGRWLRGVDSYMQKMEWLVDAMDAGDINGPARRNIKRPIDEANARRNEMGDRIFKQLKTLVDARPEADVRDRFESTGVTFPGMDRPLNRSQLVSWALNLGTEENRKVAILGEGLMNPDGSLRPEFDQALSALRKSELEFVQGVWDTLNGLLPDIKAKALRVSGVEPKLKKVTPFQVKTVDGHTVEMQGGYYPLKGDPVLNDVGRRQQDPSLLDARGFSRPTTSTSHLKEVTGATYRLMLDYEHVLSQHLADVINDTAAGEAIDQVYRFISNKRVRQIIQETLGEKEANEFLPWLQDFANNKKGDPNEGGPLIRFLMSRRTGMVAARLGGNLGSYLVQAGDIFKALADPDVKTSYIAKAFLDIRRNPSDVIEQIREMSPNEMRHREENFNREIRDMLTSKTIFDEKKAAVTEFVMQGFQVMDRLVTFPVWLARYRQGLAEHGNSEQAIREADRVIARSFQAGDPRNMSRMMREQGMMKLFTTFQGDANTWYGLISSSVRSGNPRSISLGIMALIFEQIVGQAIKNRLPDKDENKAGWLFEQALLAGVGKIPVFGDLAQFSIDKLKGKHASLENPTMQTMEKIFSVPKSVYDYGQGKEDFQAVAQDAVEAAGLWLGIPGTSQAVRSWKYLHKVQTGKENPKSAGELVVNTVMGKPKEKKR